MPGTATAQKYESFASVLTGFTASSRPTSPAEGDGLEDDIATISYEKALRNQSHKRAVAKSPSPKPTGARATAATRKQPVSIRTVPLRIAQQPAPELAPASPSHRRSSSVTVRLTAAEHAQLRERATAAGLSASAYLRSCLVEAEELRAQVRQALEQFRAAAAPATQATPGPTASTRPPSFFARLLDRIRA